MRGRDDGRDDDGRDDDDDDDDGAAVTARARATGRAGRGTPRAGDAGGAGRRTDVRRVRGVGGEHRGREDAGVGRTGARGAERGGGDALRETRADGIPRRFRRRVRGARERWRGEHGRTRGGGGGRNGEERIRGRSRGVGAHRVCVATRRGAARERGGGGERRFRR